jgi:DeoD family purine-nucleoside phosphorylase
VSEAIHIIPTAPLAERVLMPGDPGRALMLAQMLLERPKMFNHNRGLWGYSGTAVDGEPLTIQSSGMGGPSAAIVLFELAGLGARRVIRVGTCGAFEASFELGALLVARDALVADGTSHALGARERASADPVVTDALVAAAAEPRRTVVSTDLFYADHEAQRSQWAAAGAVAVEMECAAIFTLAANLGLSAAAVLTVSDALSNERERIDPERLRAAERRMGEVALRALAP